MNKLGRLLTAMVTPFNAEGALDYRQARALARALLDSGSDGVLVSGTTGKSPTLTREEKLRLFAEVKSEVANRGAVVAGTGNYNTRESQELTKEAEKIGVDACLLVVPYYNRPTQQGLYQHFKAIAEVTSLPCIIYNVPSRTVTNISADTVIKLSQINNIVGIKEASGNLEQIAKIIEETKAKRSPEPFAPCYSERSEESRSAQGKLHEEPDNAQDRLREGSGKFLVYSGNDNDTLPILALGGYGVISVASHILGIQIKKMMEKFLNGEVQEAASIHRHLLPLLNTLFVVPNPVPIKYALNYLGFPVGKPRLPLVEPDEEPAQLIRATLARYKIDLPLPSSKQKSKGKSKNAK